MRFSDVEARLALLPVHLPRAPHALLPVLLTDEGEFARPSMPVSRREAAVLLLVHPDTGGEARIILTERTAGGYRHAGQVSFPGGAIDEGDESITAAALREAREEIGLDAAVAEIHIRRVLAPVGVHVSGFLVHTVVATAPRQPTLIADPREVAAIIHAPLDAFLPDATIEIVEAEIDGGRLRYGAYRVNDHLVWGATAGILGRLGAFLAPPGSADYHGSPSDES